jgi:hypothetical protein
VTCLVQFLKFIVGVMDYAGVLFALVIYLIIDYIVDDSLLAIDSSIDT